MKQNEVVSVIMSTYNETETELKQSIESILNQTWKDIEFIIVNDNPDNMILEKVLYRYEESDSRIKLLRNEKNIGLANSLNFAWKQSKGKYIARMDADDICTPERIKREVEFLEKYSLDMVSSNRINISETGEEIEYFGRLPQGRAAEKLLPYGNPVIHPSVLLKSSVMERMGGYRNFSSAQDYDLWLRMLTLKYKIGILDEPLIYYRVRKNGISKTNHYKQFLMTQYARVLFRERRKRNGKDFFSEENMARYIGKRYTERKKERFDKAYQYYDKAVKSLKSKKYLSGCVCMARVMLTDRNCASEIFYLLKYGLKKAQLLKVREKK